MQFSSINFGHYIPLSMIAIALFGIGLLLQTEEKVLFHPGQVYTDQDLQGKSQAERIQVLDSQALHLQWKLQTGYEYPFAGWTWNLKDSNGKCADWASVKELNIDLRSEQTLWVNILVKSVDWQNKERIAELAVQTQNRRQTHLLQTWKIPEWFIIQEKLDPGSQAVFTESVCNIEILFQEPTPAVGKISVLELEIVREHPLQWLLWALSLMSLVGAIWRWNQWKNRLHQDETADESDEESDIIWNPEIQPLPATEAHRLQKILESEFQDPELTMEAWASKAGTTTHKAGQWLKQNAGMNFKAILNQLRMQAAEKWLVETDEQVAQIAMKCGYNHVTHFHRVFREHHGMSPNEWRKSKTGRAGPADPTENTENPE